MSPLTAPPDQAGWQGLFWSAFRQSKNPMVLLDGERIIVDVNGPFLRLFGYERDALLGRPVYNLRVHGTALPDREWKAALRKRQFTGVGDFRCADGRSVRVEFAAHPEVVTGRQLALFVALHTGQSRSPHLAAAPRVGGPEPLTQRESEVVRLIALGLSGPEIADELHLAHNTVRTHIRNAMRKRGARSRAQLVAMALSAPHPHSRAA
jgi:PAS domain S-box-containing protein